MAFRGSTAISYGLKGSADISGILLCKIGNVSVGIRIEIECKSGMARQSTEQQSFQAMIEDLGGIYLVARISDEKFVKQAVEQTLDQLQKILRLRGFEIPS